MSTLPENLTIVAGSAEHADLHNEVNALVNDLVAGGGGGGAVASVNGQTGVVVLDAADVDADPEGSAAAVAASIPAAVAAAAKYPPEAASRLAPGMYVPVNQTGSNNVTTGKAIGDTLGRCPAVPFSFSRTVTPVSFHVNVTTLFAASFVRLGIYADNGSHKPGALLQDYGQVSSATTGVKDFANTLEFQAGVTYWHVVAVQGAGGNTVAMSYNVAGPGVDVGDPTVATAFTAIRMGYDISGVTGAMPANLTASAVNGAGNSYPRLVVRIPV